MTIPVVFSTNKNFVEYTAVCIYSMLCNADKNNEYDVYIFNVDLLKEDETTINVITQMFDNVNISFINVSNYLSDIKIDYDIVINHVTVEMFFRIYIPKILSKYNKAIYLDSDMIIVGDISKLYNIDLNDNIIGAIPSTSTSVTSHINYIENYLELDVKYYFNSGVLLINNFEFEKQKIREKCTKLLLEENKFVCPDQDVLNITTNKKVLYLDKTWNTPFNDIDGNLPNIIHYLGAIKPWNYLSFLPCNHIFWEYAKLCNLQEKIILKSIQNKKFENYYLEGVLPFQEMPENSKIVLYGANMKGLMIRRQIESLSYYKFVMQCDKNYKNLNLLDYYKKHRLIIKSPEELIKTDFDYIVICANTQAIKKSITNDLIDLGVLIDKILEV